MSLYVKTRVAYPGFVLDVEVDCVAQGVTAFFGASGSGKTSLLRVIAGLDCQKDSVVRLGDQQWQDTGLWVPPYERSIGYVAQEAALFPHLSVTGNLHYALKRAKSQSLSLQEAAALCGLTDLLGRSVSKLSGGEKQRVVLARALLAAPDILLLDEPLSALDLDAREDLMNCLLMVRDRLNIPMLYVSHSINEIAKLADHVYLLGDGKVVSNGLVNTVLTSLDLPLSKRVDATAVLNAKVLAHDEEDVLTELEMEGARLFVPRIFRAVGEQVRLKISASDVSVSLRPVESSILNSLSASVVDFQDLGQGQLVLRLAVGSESILARITRRSARQLKLEKGSQVYAQVKSVALS